MREVNIDELLSMNININETNVFQPKHTLARRVCAKIQSHLYKEKIPSMDIKKNYEIYKIIIDGNEEIFTANIKYLPKTNCDNQELYFDKDIALEISKNLNSINNCAFNSCPEIMEEYQYEIYMKEKEFEELKRIDELKFKKNIKRSELVKKGLLNLKENNYKTIRKEQDFLQEQVKKYQIINNQLMKKLEISLKKYEEIYNKKNNIFNKLFLKLFKKERM